MCWMPDAAGAKTAIEIAQRVGTFRQRCRDRLLRSVFSTRARADARAAGLANLTFVEADVQTYAFEPVYDFCFSRFRKRSFSKTRLLACAICAQRSGPVEP